MSNLTAAMKRAQIPDHSAGPMSLAMEDRRVLAKEIERLRAEIDELRHEQSDANWQRSVQQKMDDDAKAAQRQAAKPLDSP